MNWIKVEDQLPEEGKDVLFKMITPTKRFTYCVGRRNNPRSYGYEWEANLEDTYHGGYLEAPYDVIEWCEIEP